MPPIPPGPLPIPPPPRIGEPKPPGAPVAPALGPFQSGTPLSSRRPMGRPDDPIRIRWAIMYRFESWPSVLDPRTRISVPSGSSAFKSFQHRVLFFRLRRIERRGKECSQKEKKQHNEKSPLADLRDC